MDCGDLIKNAAAISPLQPFAYHTPMMLMLLRCWMPNVHRGGGLINHAPFTICDGQHRFAVFNAARLLSASTLQLQFLTEGTIYLYIFNLVEDATRHGVDKAGVPKPAVVKQKGEKKFIKGIGLHDSASRTVTVPVPNAGEYQVFIVSEDVTATLSDVELVFQQAG
jgi:hypothetical protein